MVEPYAGLDRSVVEAAGEDWAKVSKCNSWLGSLAKRRATRIERTGPLASMLAWEVAVLQQALLYRIVELTDGCTKMWNEGNVLCSILAARALMETIGLTLDIEEKVQKHFDANDFKAMDELLWHHTFASREDKFIEEHSEAEAKNALTYVDRMEKILDYPGIRHHYLGLCEFCHPNAYGHYFAFGSLDTTNGTVTFSKRKLHDGEQLKLITKVLVMLGFVVQAMDRLDDLVQEISKAHPSPDPLPRSERA